MADNWIKGAIKKPGALHSELGVPQGHKIPADTLMRASHAGGKLGERARMAETMRGFADGGAVAPEPSKYSRLFDFLFGHKALDAASKVGDQPSQTMPQNQTAPQDNSAVKEAARQAAERMQKAKDANKGQTPEAFCGGGMVRPGNYGR